MPVSIKGSGGGGVTLDAGAASTNTTLTLPNTNATIATTTGTLTNPTINGFTGDTSIINVGSGQIYKDASGNVGIGTSSPTRPLTISAAAASASLTSTTGTNAVNFNFNNTGGLFAVGIDNSAGTGFGAGAYGRVLYSDGAYPLVMYTNATERARITAGGNLLVNWTAAATYKLFVSADSAGSDYPACFNNANSGSSNYVVVDIFRNNTRTGNISNTNATTFYNTSSDYRLKHSVTPMSEGLATVAALKPVTYKWNIDDSDGEGFIAHELAEVIPLAVNGEKDALEKDGSINPQSVDYSKIVVHLVAACQELKADLDAAKAEIAALKGSA